MSPRDAWFAAIRASIADGTFGSEPDGLTPAEQDAHAEWCASILAQL